KWKNGFWEIKDSTLILYSIPASTQTQIDSSAVSSINGTTSIQHYKNGQLVYNSDNPRAGPGVEFKEFKIKAIGNDQFNLIDQGKIISYSIKTESIESTFGIESILRGLLGIITLLFVGWLLSSNRKAIKWSIIFKGIGIQIVF